MTFGHGVPILTFCIGKQMKIFTVGGGIQVGSMWDPCGILVGSARISMGSCSGSSGIRVGSREKEKEEVERESQWRGWGREGMKTNDRTDGDTTPEMKNYVAYALPGA